MKRIIIVALGCLLTLNISFAGDPSSSDQKWLTAVEKMITTGRTEVSTPSKDRMDLLKDWAKKIAPNYRPNALRKTSLVLGMVEPVPQIFIPNSA